MLSANSILSERNDSLPAPPQGISAADFETIEDAVMETERGRWFLAEFIRRRRAEDTTLILAAIDRLEARAARADAAEARTRLEADRVAGILAELATLLRELGFQGEARALPRSTGPTTRSAAGELEARLAALVELDALDVEKKLKLFG
jgi:hypothetical protein